MCHYVGGGGGGPGHDNRGCVDNHTNALHHDHVVAALAASRVVACFCSEVEAEAVTPLRAVVAACAMPERAVPVGARAMTPPRDVAA